MAKKNIAAREAALQTLARCRRDGAWSGSAIDTAIKKYELEPRDASLSARLSLGVLQNSTLCDYYIGCFCTQKLEPQVRDILRLGVYQLLFMDRIPARAAVNETVALCESSGCRRAASLVNAVLRKISDNRASLPEIPDKGTAKHLSIKYSHPEWLCAYVMDSKGYDFAEEFLRRNNEPAPLNIQINTLKTDIDSYMKLLDEAGMVYIKPEYPDNCLLLEGTAAFRLPGFEEGLFYVQDRAARLSVAALGLEEGMKVLDVCSCPGGKSFAAAIAMNNKGSITSCDIHEKKLNLVRTGADRLGITIIGEKAADGREFIQEFNESFDAVIADVPCSGMGVIGKKPEIRTKTREEIARLPEIQAAILENASRYVRHGGSLLYSTCTVIREENEAVVEAFLSSHTDYELNTISVGAVQAESGMYTFWQNTDNTDGFFCAVLRRK